MAIIGYIKVSSNKQTLEHQRFEIERQLISERTKSSLANIKANGKKLGRPFNAKTKNLKLAKNQKQIQKLLSQGISKSKIAKLFGVERATLYRYILRLSSQA